MCPYLTLLKKEEEKGKKGLEKRRKEGNGEGKGRKENVLPAFTAKTSDERTVTLLLGMKSVTFTQWSSDTHSADLRWRYNDTHARGPAAPPQLPLNPSLPPLPMFTWGLARAGHVSYQLEWHPGHRRQLSPLPVPGSHPGTHEPRPGTPHLCPTPPPGAAYPEVSVLIKGQPVKDAKALLRYALPISNKPIKEVQLPLELITEDLRLPGLKALDGVERVCPWPLSLYPCAPVTISVCPCHHMCINGPIKEVQLPLELITEGLRLPGLKALLNPFNPPQSSPLPPCCGFVVQNAEASGPC